MNCGDMHESNRKLMNKIFPHWQVRYMKNCKLNILARVFISSIAETWQLHLKKFHNDKVFILVLIIPLEKGFKKSPFVIHSME
jgi:hypothetical protein